MTAELLLKKITKVKKIIEESNILLERITNIFVKNENVNVAKITHGIEHITSIINKLKFGEDTTKKISLYENVINLNILIDIVKNCFTKILDKKVNIETFLSQTFIDETREYNQKVQVLFAKTKKEMVEIDRGILYALGEEISKKIINVPNIVQEFKEFTKIIIGMPRCITLYTEVSNKVLQHVTESNVHLSYEIINIIESVKNHILSLRSEEKTISYASTNPFVKNFGLVNTSGLLNMAGIVKAAFKIEIPQRTETNSEDSGSIKDLIKICKEKSYDLILIEHMLNRGIEYNILPLVDFVESKQFDRVHNSDDGISSDIINRNRTIDYISKSPVKWNIKYEYSHEDINNKFVLIIRELYPGKYCILTNKLEADIANRLYFVRKSSVGEFLHFVKTKQYNGTRVGNYNDLLNEKITNNMFLFVKPDIDTLKIKSQIADPKYLRNEIYVLILSKFKKMLDKASMKTIYDFSVLVHDESFLKIFSQVIMNEYYKYLFKNTSIYETENISVSEVFASFLSVINIYERDFTKHMHDIFITKIPDKSIFSDGKKNNILYDLFNDILKDVLSRIITNESNIFQTLIYKLYLYKLSILD
jgi:hypothetical protein